jgi:hypothetical protein
MDIFDKRAGRIINKLTDIIAQTEELKLDNGTTPRAVRQWKKDVRTKYLSGRRERGRGNANTSSVPIRDAGVAGGKTF